MPIKIDQICYIPHFSSDLKKNYMKTFYPHQKSKKDKENFRITSNLFFPNIRDPSQTVTIDKMLFLDSSRSMQNTNTQSFVNFRKNFNKVESNIKDSKTLNLPTYQKINSSSFLDRAKLTQTCTVAKLSSKKNPLFKGLERTKCKDLLQKNKLYPRFKVLQLYAIYESLIKYSRSEPQKFLQAFESCLNFQKIMLKPEVIKKCLYEQKSFSFESFLVVFKRLEDLMFIQGITDYLEIIFECYKKQPMSRAIVVEVLGKRSDLKDAEEIGRMIYSKLRKTNEDTVTLKEITRLCEEEFEFSSCLSQLYQQEVMNSH